MSRIVATASVRYRSVRELLRGDVLVESRFGDITHRLVEDAALTLGPFDPTTGQYAPLLDGQPFKEPAASGPSALGATTGTSRSL